MKKNELIALRKQLYAYGYFPLPNTRKMCLVKGWNQEGFYDQWGGPEQAFEVWDCKTIGAVLRNRLGVIDGDLDDPELIALLARLIAEVAPEVEASAPLRYGSGTYKAAWFVQIEGELFNKIPKQGRKYMRKGEFAAWRWAAEHTPMPDYHQLEIFGGALSLNGHFSRQFGIYGPVKGTQQYEWVDGRGLAQVPLVELPTLSATQAYAIVERFEQEIADLPEWEALPEQKQATGATGVVVFDIDTAGAVFDVAGHGKIGFAELEALVLAGAEPRLSASFIKGEAAVNKSRCVAGRVETRNCVGIWDYRDSVWHLPKLFDGAGGLKDILTREQAKCEAGEGAFKRAGPDWRERYAKAPYAPRPSLHNAYVAIVHSGFTAREDVFHNQIYLGHLDDTISFRGKVTDTNLGGLRKWLSNAYGFDLTEKHVRDAFVELAREHRFNPVVEMLAEAEANWDGVARLDRMAVDYFNGEDTALNRAMVRKTMIAAVARARTPGIKFDTILVLESPEGWDKSSAFAILAGEDNFSDERIIGQASREVQEQLAGIWIHENADLAGLRKAEVETVKAFASRQTDRARPAYGHFLVEQPRHSIEVGTTNNEEYLQSQTGNRRFWPIRVLIRIDSKKLRAARLQLWGEAAHYQSQGESLILDETLWPAAAVEQEQRRVRDVWESLLEDRLTIVTTTVAGFEDTGMVQRCGNEERVASHLILEHILKVAPGYFHEGHAKRLANCMRVLGWSPRVFKLEGKPVRGYTRMVS